MQLDSRQSSAQSSGQLPGAAPEEFEYGGQEHGADDEGGTPTSTLILPGMFEDVRGVERARIRRDLRRRHLSDLGWTIVTDDTIYAPGEDPDEASEIWSLAAAARKAGLPMDLDELHQWSRDRARMRSLARNVVEREPEAVSSTGGREAHIGARRDAAATYPAVEEHITERANISQNAMEREALRAESALVRRFASYLEQIGHETSGVVVQVEQEVIRADLFDRSELILYEAKASADRQKIRMAIGQLLDYRRFIVPEPQLRVLVPAQPNPDLCRLLAVAGVGAAWPEGDGWCDRDHATLASQPNES